MSHPIHSFLSRPACRSLALLAAAAFICLCSAPIFAQPTPAGDAAAKNDELLKLDQLVVTGSVTPQTKLDSALAVTTVDPGQIQTTAPRSTAEMLKLIPGIYTESSGGEVGNNLVARGVATGGSVSGYLYVALQEDGLPVWSESNFRFTQADTFVRVTNFVDRIEALRGGSSGVFASSDPLGIINFITREGTQEMHGEYKLETGDFGLIRNEGWIAGPISRNTTFALGGFYRIDDGIRAPGYAADKGGQLMGNVKYNFPDDKGSIKLLAKVMDDNPEFELPFPLATAPVAVGGTVHPSTIPGGPDMNTAAIVSPDLRRLSFPGSPMGPINIDLADGESANYGYLGTDLDYHLTDTLRLKMLQRYSAGSHKEVRDSFGTTDTLQDIVNGLATKANSAGAFAAALIPGSFSISPISGASTQNYNFKLTYPGQVGAVAAANPAAAAVLNGNGLGNPNSMTNININLKNYQNDLRLVQTFNDGNTSLTGGLYYSYFQVATVENVDQQLIDISNSYHRLDVTFLDAAAGTPIGQYTYNGMTQLGTTYINSYAEKREVDFFAVFTHKIKSLSLDAGYRYLKAQVSGWGEAPATYDGNPFVGTTATTNNGLGFFPALRNSTFGSGNVSNGTDSKGDHAITAGANYVFPDRHTAVFARFSRSPKMIYTNDILLEIPFGNGSGNGTPTPFRSQNHMTQYELGLKYSRSSVGLFLTAFKVEERNVAMQDTVFLANGSLGAGPFSTLDEDVYGVEIEGVWTPPIPGLSLSVHGTYQDPKFVNDVHIRGFDANFNTIQLDLSGLLPTRIPKEYGNLSASYALAMTDWGTLSINGSYQYTGRRALDQANTEFLGSFYECAAGASFETKGGLIFRVQAANLLNGRGITEGDPRATTATVANPIAPWQNFRPILPRSVVASATYRF